MTRLQGNRMTLPSAITMAILVACGTTRSEEKVAPLPTYVPLEQRLAGEIHKMIDAGHLRPVYANATEHYYASMQQRFGDNLHAYWHNPAETIYTLARALPHVPADMKGPLRKYMRAEWKYAPPTKFTHMGWRGAKREWAIIPPKIASWFERNKELAPGNYTHGRWKAWKFNPYNVYACWMYAKEFGGAEQVLSEVRSKLSGPPARELASAMPHVLNCYIAGYYGYLGLQKLAEEKPDAKVRGQALGRRRTRRRTLH